MVVPHQGDLNIEERNLLSVAYKNVVGSRRASWRTLQVEDNRSGEPAYKLLAAQFRTRVEDELETICKEVLALLESRLLQVGRTGAAAEEAAVFYLKMTADYYRYMSEFKPKAHGVEASEANSEGMAAKYYHEAMDLATKSLTPTHPIRLGLALNFSVCHYEILRNPKAACKLAKEAFDEAIKKLDMLDEARFVYAQSRPYGWVSVCVCDGSPIYNVLPVSHFVVVVGNCRGGGTHSCRANVDVTRRYVRVGITMRSYKDSTLIMQLLRDNLTLWSSESQQGMQCFLGAGVDVYLRA
jgi:14-3-3 protein epsilon